MNTFINNQQSSTERKAKYTLARKVTNPSWAQSMRDWSWSVLAAKLVQLGLPANEVVNEAHKYQTWLFSDGRRI